MNFEDLQMSWKSQPVKDPGNAEQLRLTIETNWHQHQRKVLRTNYLITFCFLLTMSGITCIYFAYYEHFGWAFKLSIISINLLMVVYLAVSWKSYGFKKENLEDPSTDYISYQLKKLNWQRKMITIYSQVYAILLWLNLMLYSWEVTARGSATFRYTTLAVLTVYIFGLNIWQRATKQKRKLKLIDEMSTALNELKTELAA